MSYLSEQKTEIRQAQVTEALLRMKKLDLHENVLKEFLNIGKLNLSETVGILYWLTDEEDKLVREWEEQTGNLVYHIIKNNTVFGLCYSFLYVSPNADEWIYDDEALEEGFPIAYVMNVTDRECSEYGSIGIVKSFGGLRRTA